MNKLNNFSNMKHVTGNMYITKNNERDRQGVNICHLSKNGGDYDFKVIAFVERYGKAYTNNGKDFYTAEDIVKQWANNNGTPYMYEDKKHSVDIASCAICKGSFPEEEVNMVDYEDDVCIRCEE